MARHFLINATYYWEHVADGTYQGRWTVPGSPPSKGDFLETNTCDFADTVRRRIPAEAGVEFTYPVELPDSPDYDKVGQTSVMMDGGMWDDFCQARHVYQTR
jgi:hypothetical protein